MSIKLKSLVAISLTLIVGIALFAVARPVLAAIGPGSCATGTSPCGPPGPTDVGTNSCNGDLACLSASGPIGDNACNGIGACQGATVPIGDNACNSNYACLNTTVPIPDNACNGVEACRGATGPISTNACNGEKACFNTSGPIGDNSCNARRACESTTGPIGSYSCNGDLACYFFASGSIGAYSCNGGNACRWISTSVGFCSNNTVPVTCPATAPVEPQDPWYYAPDSLTDAHSAPFLTVPNDGQVACGVWENGWYGLKFIHPDKFPDCDDLLPDGVTVACLNEFGEWNTANIPEQGINSEGVYYAQVMQHGHCAVFPK